MGLRFDSSPPLVWWVYLLFAVAAAGLAARTITTPVPVAVGVALFLGSFGGVLALVVRLLASDATNEMWLVAVVLYPLVTAVSIALGTVAGASARHIIGRAPSRAIQKPWIRGARGSRSAAPHVGPSGERSTDAMRARRIARRACASKRRSSAKSRSAAQWCSLTPLQPSKELPPCREPQATPVTWIERYLELR